MKKLLSLFIFCTLAFTASAQTVSIIYFDSNKNELKKESVHVLDSLTGVLAAAKNSSVEIKAYCDNTGNDPGNLALSDARAKAVSGFLKNKNIHHMILSAKGYGASAPKGDNATEDGKAMNRRAEITLFIQKTELQKAISTPDEPFVKKEEPKVPKKEEAPALLMTRPEVLEADLKLAELEPGKILLLKNLNFYGGTAQLLPESKAPLKLLLTLMKDNPTLEIEIEGHVCCFNDYRLSVDRALVVLEYLSNNGIDESRLKYAGHGNNNPITEERTEDERIMNRRVEIMILKK